VIGCEDRLQNDLYCVEWGVKLYAYSNQNQIRPLHFERSVVVVLRVVSYNDEAIVPQRSYALGSF